MSGPVAAVLALLLAIGCTSPAAVPRRDILTPLVPPGAIQPSQADLVSERLIAAALVSDQEAMSSALELLEIMAEDPALESEVDAKRRIPLSQDLVNATLDDPRAYRAACKKLSKTRGLDPALKKSLKDCYEDDPLRLARRRTLDVWESLWALTFNAASEPLGRSLLSGLVLAPYYIASSAAHYLASINERDRFPVQYRQALVHRERYLARYPDSPESPEIEEKVAKARRGLAKDQCKRNIFAAEQSLERGNPRYAAVMAHRALDYDPESKKAADLVHRAEAWIAQERALMLRSEQAVAPPARVVGPGSEEFAVAMLAPDAEPAVAARRLLQRRLLQQRLLQQGGAGEESYVLALSQYESDAEAQRASWERVGEASYVLAMAQFESGAESASWERLGALAKQDPTQTAMSRHATALLVSPTENPYRTFRASERRQQRSELRWWFLGPFAGGPRYRALPPLISYALDAPSVANTIVTAPLRFVFSPLKGKPDFQQPTAIAGYRYLEREPEGDHRRDVVEWLYSYEKKRKNWNAALSLADYDPHFNPKDRAELVEKAARDRIVMADRFKRRDQRSTLYRGIAREFPESSAGHTAGLLARVESEEATAQSIRMTRGFLVENPMVSGPRGLGIRPELIDEDPRNGELHARGVTFVGGRVLEFEFLNESGDEDDAAQSVHKQVSPERLSQLVAMLDEAARRNMKVDPDDAIAANAQRELFFERARLGLADRPDPRPTAQSHYVFESNREKFGMVRGRESILPFDLVFQGSFSNLGLAAYPRWRMPRETPDAFLYR
jgi:hypothetical protein